MIRVEKRRNTNPNKDLAKKVATDMVEHIRKRIVESKICDENKMFFFINKINEELPMRFEPYKNGGFNYKNGEIQFKYSNHITVFVNLKQLSRDIQLSSILK